jgi:hypothetical protein
VREEDREKDKVVVKSSTVYAVIDGQVLGIIAFYNKEDAEAWAQKNQPQGEALAYSIVAVGVYPDVESAGTGSLL